MSPSSPPGGADEPPRSAVGATALPAAAKPAEAEKPHGMLGGMIANWAGECVIVVSGFVLPRLIDERMSQAELGIWDFGWSIRSYIALSCTTLGSGAGYYVARYRASERWSELNRTLSAMMGLVVYATLLAAVLTGVLAAYTPFLVNSDSPRLLHAARSLVLTMGLASCAATPNLVYAGVITGSRRFDLLNLIDGLCDVYVVASVIACVWNGYGLEAMGYCVLGRELLNGVGKFLVARRVAPLLRIRPAWTDWAMYKEIFGFSGKTLIDVLGKVVQSQTSVMVVSSVLGPLEVALFSRPRALILITTRFVMGFARVLVPAASALREKQDQKGLGELLIRATRYGMYLSIPPALILVILGHKIIELWMGSGKYADTDVLMILVLGYFPLFAQQATFHVLLGLASHGLAGTASFVGALLSLVLTLLFVGVFHWGISGAAAATAIPVALVNVFVLPYAGCRAVGVPLRRYVSESIRGPIVLTLPFAGVLAASRIFVGGKPWQTLLAGLGVGVPMLLVMYWRSVLPAHIKDRLLRVFRRNHPAPRVAGESLSAVSPPRDAGA